MCAPKHSGLSGHTLAELVIVVVLTGILAGVAVNGFASLLPAGRQESVVGRARLLNAARSTYALSVADAHERWAAAGDDAARLGLLREAGLVDGGVSDHLSLYGEYTLTLSGTLREPTLVLHKGEPMPYSR